MVCEQQAVCIRFLFLLSGPFVGQHRCGQTTLSFLWALTFKTTTVHNNTPHILRTAVSQVINQTMCKALAVSASVDERTPATLHGALCWLLLPNKLLQSTPMPCWCVGVAATMLCSKEQCLLCVRVCLALLREQHCLANRTGSKPPSAPNAQFNKPGVL